MESAWLISKVFQKICLKHSLTNVKQRDSNNELSFINTGVNMHLEEITLEKSQKLEILPPTALLQTIAENWVPQAMSITLFRLTRLTSRT